MKIASENLRCLVESLSKVYKTPCVFLVKDESTNITYPTILRDGEIDATVMRALGDCCIKDFDIKNTVCVSLTVNPKDV